MKKLISVGTTSAVEPTDPATSGPDAVEPTAPATSGPDAAAVAVDAAVYVVTTGEQPDLADLNRRHHEISATLQAQKDQAFAAATLAVEKAFGKK